MPYLSVNLTRAVRYASRVLDIDIVHRKHISTPWASRGNPDDQYLLFHIADPQKLPQPIWNIDRHRVSFRWGTRYSLEHVSTMSELYLETEAERRLWEELKNAGIPFTTEAGRVSDINPEDPSGRTTFTLNEGIRIRYQGLGKFQAWDQKCRNTRTFTIGDLRTRDVQTVLRGLLKLE